MKNRDIQNERPDKIGRALLEASRLQSDEIENIVAAPFLFESVKARIEAEKSNRRSFGNWAGFAVWTWQWTAITCGILAVFLTGIISLIIFTNQQPSLYAAVEVPVQIESARMLPTISDPDLRFIETTQSSDLKQQTLAQQEVFKNEATRVLVRSRPHAKREEVSEFYAITSADNSEDAEDNAQIVRVELPRSSLLAMGVDVPAENESARVKTDLLIGSDGVMKAVRFVK